MVMATHTPRTAATPADNGRCAGGPVAFWPRAGTTRASPGSRFPTFEAPRPGPGSGQGARRRQHVVSPAEWAASSSTSGLDLQALRVPGAADPAEDTFPATGPGAHAERSRWAPPTCRRCPGLQPLAPGPCGGATCLSAPCVPHLLASGTSMAVFLLAGAVFPLRAINPALTVDVSGHPGPDFNDGAGGSAVPVGPLLPRRWRPSPT